MKGWGADSAITGSANNVAVKTSAATIGEAEKIIGVKAHILHYWEKEFPMLQPIQEKSGRHVYSPRDIELLLRIKYLLHERRYTVEGARHQLFLEISGAKQDIHAQISLMRSELFDVRAKVRELGRKLEKALAVLNQ